VFGDIDKGAGIDVPLDELQRPSPIPPRRESRAGVTVAEANRPAGARTAPAAPAESVWRRLLRGRGMRPRPSGT
jgi:hypothetical protein